MANTNPIFSGSGLISNSRITNSITALTGSTGVAATGVSGTGGEMIVVCTADATNGSYLERVRLRWTATTPTATTATTVRLYISTVTSGATTADNTSCFEEVVMGIQNASNATAATFPYDIPLNFVLPAGKTLLASVHQKPAASAEISIQCYGGNF